MEDSSDGERGDNERGGTHDRVKNTQQVGLQRLPLKHRKVTPVSPTVFLMPMTSRSLALPLGLCRRQRVDDRLWLGVPV